MEAPTRQPFGELINGETPVLVDFFAAWCGPCKTMAPVLKDFATRMGNRVRVLKIDIDKSPATAANYRIQGVPTLILFRKGQIVWRQSGVVPLRQLEQALVQAETTA
ncbi:thioredoxin [Fibrella arboris]|uniref:thioredoxin n=1 Tax=Fibrella arboris TaxID=3242486 RepID=UPI0035222EB5